MGSDTMKAFQFGVRWPFRKRNAQQEPAIVALPRGGYDLIGWKAVEHQPVDEPDGDIGGQPAPELGLERGDGRREAVPETRRERPERG